VVYFIVTERYIARAPGLIFANTRADISREVRRMIWFFTRGAAQIDIEVHRGPEPNGFTLAVTYPDGAERIERFATAARLATRALTIQQRLIDEGWMPSSPATGHTMVPRTHLKRHARLAAAAARQARRARYRLIHARQSITKRFAAVLGL
jgi:hypothetical protein